VLFGRQFRWLILPFMKTMRQVCNDAGRNFAGRRSLTAKLPEGGFEEGIPEHFSQADFN